MPKHTTSKPLFYARFDRDGLTIHVHELEEMEFLVSRDHGALPSGRREEKFGTRKEAIATALGYIDDYT